MQPNAISKDVQPPHPIQTIRIWFGGKIFRSGFFYAKAGVLLYNLRESGKRQMVLWEYRGATAGNG